MRLRWWIVKVSAQAMYLYSQPTQARNPVHRGPPLSYPSGCSSGGAPTPAGTSVFTKHNWDMGMGYLWLNGWGIYHLMGGAFMGFWVGHL